MKATLLFIALFITTIAAKAQAYHPLLDNPSWIVYKFNVGAVSPSQNLRIAPGVDTDIDGVAYKKFIDPYVAMGDNNVYLREDLAQQKVYQLKNGVERLIYDFSLETGDTFTQDSFTYAATVDNIQVNGETRKKIELQSIVLYNGHDLRQTWIEGIGGTSHPLRPDYNAHSRLLSAHQFVYSKCTFQNGQHIYGDPICETLLTTIDNPMPVAIELYPNPFTETLTVQNSQEFHEATLKLYNSNGQLVRQMEHLNGQKILLAKENLANGLYLIQVSESGNLLHSAKVWITD